MTSNHSWMIRVRERAREEAATQMIELMASLMDKLGSKDRHSAALKAMRLGLIVIEDVHGLTLK